MHIEDLINSDKIFMEFISNIPGDIRGRITVRRFLPKAVVARKGEKIKYISVIYSGKMHVINEFDSGQIYTFADIGFMDIVGDIEILAEKFTAACTVEAITDCIVLEMSCEDFIKAFEISHNFSKQVARMIAKKMYSSSFNNGEAIFYSVKHNVASFIIKYAQKRIMEENIVVINLLRQEIADTLGISTRSVNRAVKAMKDENLISTKKGKININKNQYSELINSLENLKYK